MTKLGTPLGLIGAWMAFNLAVTSFAGAAVAQSQPQAQPRRESPAAAQPKREAVPPPASMTAAPPAPTAPVAQVTGFRSATFGMSERDVRAAIAKDFGVKPDAIKAETNPSEQTRVLIIQAPDVLPGGGTAEVSYVFGFKSKNLIQVGVSWSKTSDDKMTPEQLFSNSSILRAHFIAAGYKPDTVASNRPINGGRLMFRGSDDKGRTTMLVLQGTLTKGDNDQRVLTPNGLVLFYVADAKTPDIYRLTPGSF
jgi:hypothetical protein